MCYLYGLVSSGRMRFIFLVFLALSSPNTKSILTQLFGIKQLLNPFHNGFHHCSTSKHRRSTLNTKTNTKEKEV